MGDGMKSVLRNAAVAACLVLVAGCSADTLITGGELTQPGRPTGTITVINGTSRVIDVVLISECGAATYGLDRLPDNLALASGQRHSFVVSAGCWDVDAGSVGYGEARQRLSVAARGTTEYTVTD